MSNPSSIIAGVVLAVVIVATFRARKSFGFAAGFWCGVAFVALYLVARSAGWLDWLPSWRFNPDGPPDPL